jgi:hypothetical protein
MSNTFYMDPMHAPRIFQLSADGGVGDIGLSGAVSGHKALNQYYSVGEPFYYTITWGLHWESGIGELASSFVLKRTTVLQSSNGGERVHLGNAGTTDKVIIIDSLPASLHEPERNILMSPVARAAVGSAITISDTGYFVYIGKSPSGLFTTAFVEFHVTTAGAGAQTADVGIFSSPKAPDKTAQTLSKRLTASTVDSLTSTGVKRNTGNFASAFTQPGHFWVGLRTAMATTQPTLAGLAGDMSQGHVLEKAACGAFASLGATFSTSLPALGTGIVAPDLRLTGM